MLRPKTYGFWPTARKDQRPVPNVPVLTMGEWGYIVDSVRMRGDINLAARLFNEIPAMNPDLKDVEQSGN